MPNPDLIPVPFAQDGQKNTIQLDRIVSDPAYRATWLEGFPANTRIPKEVGGEGPDGLDFNGILNALSQAVVFLQKGNAYQFDASLAPYPIGALVRSNDNLTTYQSTIAANSNDPNSDMTGWRVYNSSNFLVNDLTTGGTNAAITAEAVKLFFEMFRGGANHFKIPNPLNPSKPWIVQFSTISSANVSTTIATFPIAFPNSFKHLICCGYNVSGGINASVTFNGATKTTASFNCFRANAGSAQVLAEAGGVVAYYLAIGD